MKLDYNTGRKNVRYHLTDTDITCYILLSGKPNGCKIMVNHKWRSAEVVATRNASVLFEYDGDSGKPCYQEWIAEPNGSYKRLKSYGSRLPMAWRIEMQ